MYRNMEGEPRVRGDVRLPAPADRHGLRLPHRGARPVQSGGHRARRGQTTSTDVFVEGACVLNLFVTLEVDGKSTTTRCEFDRFLRAVLRPAWRLSDDVASLAE
jgi:hypothetical protein